MHDVWTDHGTHCKMKRVYAHEIYQHVRKHHVAIDPDLSQVEGLTPEHWKIVQGKVLPKHPKKETTLEKPPARGVLSLPLGKAQWIVASVLGALLVSAVILFVHSA